MSTIDLNGISVSLDGLNTSLDSYTPMFQNSPKINTTLFTSDLLSGLTLDKKKVTKTLEYKADIFSELPRKVFDKTYNQQIANVMLNFQSEFIDRLSEHRGDSVIPKLEYAYDEEEEAELIRMTSQWDCGNAMLYFSFEKDVDESNFGMIWNDNHYQNYQTRSGNLFLNDIKEIIHEAIDFIFRVYNV